MSLLSAGCLLWLERLQPVFAVIALATLGWQSWLMVKRPARRRTLQMRAIWWCSLAVNGLVFAAWIALSLRYR